MAQPGWYDDPDGTPNRLRYWDGQQWSTQTQYKPVPGAAPSPSYPQQPPASPNPQPHAGRTPAATGRRRRGPLRLLIPAAAVLLGLWLVTNVLFSPAGGGVVPAPAPPTGAAPTLGCPDLPASGRTIGDGVVQVTVPQSWSIARAADWSSCGGSRSREVATGWFAMAMAGTVDMPAELTPRQAAEEVWGWNVATNYASTSPAGNVATSEATTVQGRTGWRIKGEVLVTGAPFRGDDVEILVLERPDGRDTAVMTVSTIDDAQTEAEAAEIWKSLRVQ